MNKKTLCGDTNLSIAPKNTPFDATQAQDRVKEFVGASDKPNSEYGKSFLVCNGDTESFSDYDLQFADVISGKLKIIPNAIYSIAESLNVDQAEFSDDEDLEIKTVLETIYHRMAKQFKDDSIVAPWATSKEAKFSNESNLAEFKQNITDSILGPSVVYENSTLFEVGDYPDKDFSLTDAEMAKAVRLFQSEVDKGRVPLVNYAHCPFPGPLDGKMGDVRDIRKEGKNLVGTVVIPEWLDNVLPTDKKLSCEWDRKTKLLSGLAIVNEGRVKTAALMAAFDQNKSIGNGTANMKKTKDYNKNPMQKMHDMATSMGAECGGKSMFSVEDIAKFMTPEELKAVQGMHDSAASSGADCDAYATRNSSGMSPAYYFNTDGKTIMENTADFAEQFATIKSENETLKTSLNDVNAKNAAFEATQKDFQDQIAAMSVDMETQKEHARFADNVNFIDTLISKFQMMPAEKDEYVALAKDNSAAFNAMRPILEKRPVFARNAQSSTVSAKDVRAEFSGSSGDAYADLKAKAKEIETRDKVNFAVAYKTACTENPDIAAAYLDSRS